MTSKNKSAASDYKLSFHENDGLTKYGTHRDLMGYGRQPPAPKWPKGAKVALNFVINYEEGAESCLLHGDSRSEHLLSEINGAVPLEDERNCNMESLYDYGARVGFWRFHRLFQKKKIPATVFAAGMALERNPAVCSALKDCIQSGSDLDGKSSAANGNTNSASSSNSSKQPKWEVASHGYRWMDYQNADMDLEREHIQRTVQIHERLLGKRPVGFYQGKPNVNTRQLVIEEGGFKYDSDSYADDLPYWTINNGNKHLIIPYTLAENDMKFASTNFATGQDFYQCLKETLNFLVQEGRAGQPKMMSVGLHCRLARPGRVSGLSDFIDYAKSFHREVWICTREDIADFWQENHSPRGAGSPVKDLSKESVTNSSEVATNGDVVDDTLVVEEIEGDLI